MDKYYLLIRRFVNATFRLLMRSDWDVGFCQVYNDILTARGGPLWYFRLLPFSTRPLLDSRVQS
jgi:hypothetical protein